MWRSNLGQQKSSAKNLFSSEKCFLGNFKGPSRREWNGGYEIRSYIMHIVMHINIVRMR